MAAGYVLIQMMNAAKEEEDKRRSIRQQEEDIFRQRKNAIGFASHTTRVLPGFTEFITKPTIISDRGDLL